MEMEHTDYLFAVGSSAGIDKRPSVPLCDVFACEEWRHEFDLHSNCKDLHLIRFNSFDEYSKIPGAKALSYRWSKVLNVVCAVHAPGEKLSSPRECNLAVDAFRALDNLNSGYLWVDFLCHLDNPTHKVYVIDNMSPIYCETEVICLYLTDFCRYVQPSESEKLPRSSRRRDQCLEALRRGWIQQEVSFGRLNTAVVSEFVRECIGSSHFGLLGTLLRRRAVALGWFLRETGSQSGPGLGEQEKERDMLSLLNIADMHDANVMFDYSDTIKKYLGLPCGLFTGSPSKGVSSQVESAIREVVVKTLKASGKFPAEAKRFASWQNKGIPTTRPNLLTLTSLSC